MEINQFNRYAESGFSIIGKMCTLNDYQQLRNHFNNMNIRGNYLIVDLSRCTFSSSHGLGELVAINNTLARRKKKLILFNPRSEILSIITLAGIDKIVTVITGEDGLEKELHLEQTGT